jgi:molybdopterin converting factor small subunit
MKVDVLFFAQLKEAVGSDVRTISLDDGATVHDLVATLRSLPEWDPVASLPLSFAVNECIVGGDHALRDGDRVALLTPISGG